MNIQAPYKLESVDLENNFVSLFSNNDEIALEIEYDAKSFKDGNGFQSWNDTEIKDIKSVKAFDENGETNIFSFDKNELMILIEKYVGESL